MSLEAFLARRYLSSRKGWGLSVIAWIALAGVIVGVMSLVTVLAVMSGFERELRTKILGNNAHILVSLGGRNRSADSRSPEAVVEAIRKLRGVDSAMLVLYGEGFILSPSGQSEGVVLRGVDPENVQKVLDLKNYMKDGNWEGLKSGGAILGQSLADHLDLQVGDSFTLVLNRGDFSPLGLVPRMKKLSVSDTFHSGMTQFDGHHGYLSLSLAEQIFEMKPRSIEVRATDVRRISEVRDEIRAEIPEAIQVQDWISQNQDFLSALRLEKTVMAVILGLIVLVASFNICGSLIMIVRDKTKDIAILKSMGAYDSTVLKTFFYQGMFIGIVGTIVGVILGFVLSVVLRDYIRFPLNQDVYMIDTLPVDIRVTDLLFVILGALLISALATLYPARLASQIIPTEGLKAD
jgi:lipoprotein-releasing system permease protein